MDPTSNFNQTLTWWSVSPDGYGGDKFSAPQSLKCRWEDRVETFTSALDRQEHVSNAVVFVDTDIAVGDYLFQGVSKLVDPSVLQQAYKVHRFDRIPDLRTLQALRRAVL